MTIYDLDHLTDRIAPVQDGIHVRTDGTNITIGTKKLFTISRAEWQQFMQRFDRFCSHGDGDHRKWLKDKTWRHLYQAKKRKLPIIQGTTRTQSARAYDSIPCHHCGLLLRTRTIIQVDHTHPKNGKGYTRAIAKVFRAIGEGLVQEDGHGSKHRRIRKIVEGRATGTPRSVANLRVIRPDRPSFKPGTSQMSAKAYALSPAGIYYLSYLIFTLNYGSVAVDTNAPSKKRARGAGAVAGSGAARPPSAGALRVRERVHASFAY
ncbi:MAG: hypothetical protein AAFO58_04850, partial [Pseudomonadota bacterium]